VADLSPPQAAALLKSQGANDAEAVALAGVVRGESGGDPLAVNDKATCAPGLHATGLFQICPFPDRVAKYGDLTNPVNNARAAIDVFRSQGLSAWAGSRNSADMAAAQRAVAANPGHDAPWWSQALQDGISGAFPGLGALDALTGAGNPVSGVLKAIDWTAEIGKTLVAVGAWLSHPHNWWRMFEAVAGFAVILVGLAQLGKLPDYVTRAAKAAPGKLLAGA
jgi:hypothetical protein